MDLQSYLIKAKKSTNLLKSNPTSCLSFNEEDIKKNS
jgi:hypothetical protein